MPKVDLKVRNLETGEVLLAGFESIEDARDWLFRRPEDTEVLGVPTPHLDRETHQMLRSCVRPLGPEEEKKRKALDDEEDRKINEQFAAAARADEEEAEAHRAAMRTADPLRAMELTWTYGDGLSHVDPADERPITDAARDAVMAWIEERNEWVKDRDQIVGEAHLTVWPGPLEPGVDRVHRGGQFFPMPAPKKKEV